MGVFSFSFYKIPFRPYKACVQLQFVPLMCVLLLHLSHRTKLLCFKRCNFRQSEWFWRYSQYPQRLFWPYWWKNIRAEQLIEIAIWPSAIFTLQEAQYKLYKFVKGDICHFKLIFVVLQRCSGLHNILHIIFFTLKNVIQWKWE